MLNYHFEIVKATPLKGHKLEGAKDYATKVRVEKDQKIIFDEVIVVRKNKEGVFPDLDLINKKIAASSTRRELTEKIKEFYKHQK